MNVATRRVVSVEDYLASEPSSEVRHEYVAGCVFALEGESQDHNFLTMNLYAGLRDYLRGRPYKLFALGMRMHLEVGDESVFYYPDVLVTCDPRDTDDYFMRYPKVVIEVLSPDTERTNRREKFMAYTAIETVEEYVLVAQDRMEVTTFRRASGWAAEVATLAGEKLSLNSLDLSIEMSAVYEGVTV